MRLRKATANDIDNLYAISKRYPKAHLTAKLDQLTVLTGAGGEIVGWAKTHAKNGTTARIGGIYVSDKYHAPKVAASLLYKSVAGKYKNVTYRGKYAVNVAAIKRDARNKITLKPNRVTTWHRDWNDEVVDCQESVIPQFERLTLTHQDLVETLVSELLDMQEEASGRDDPAK